MKEFEEDENSLIDAILLLVHGLNLWHFTEHYGTFVVTSNLNSYHWNEIGIDHWLVELIQLEASPNIWVHTHENGVCTLFCQWIEIWEFCGYKATEEGMRVFHDIAATRVNIHWLQNTLERFRQLGGCADTDRCRFAIMRKELDLSKKILNWCPQMLWVSMFHVCLFISRSMLLYPTFRYLLNLVIDCLVVE